MAYLSNQELLADSIKEFLKIPEAQETLQNRLGNALIAQAEQDPKLANTIRALARVEQLDNKHTAELVGEVVHALGEEAAKGKTAATEPTERSAKRGGFTIPELLTGVAIVAVLIGLTLPAVQKVREKAARMQHDNHARQIGVALHDYESANGELPLAIKTNQFGNPETWQMQILPYIEQDALFKKYDPRKPIGQQPDVSGARINVLNGVNGPGKSDFVAIAGDGLMHTQPSTINGLLGHIEPGGSASNGVMPPEALVGGRGAHGTRLVNITDGTSNTAMILSAEDMPGQPSTNLHGTEMSRELFNPRAEIYSNKKDVGAIGTWVTAGRNGLGYTDGTNTVSDFSRGGSRTLGKNGASILHADGHVSHALDIPYAYGDVTEAHKELMRRATKAGGEINGGAIEP